MLLLASKRSGFVHCHVGSLEIVVGVVVLVARVHCHVGSLEKVATMALS